MTTLASDDLAAEVTGILRAAGRPGRHTPLTALPGGGDHTMYATDVDEQRLLVKVAAPGTGRFPNAVWAAATLAAAGVPVPRVLGHTSRVCVETRCPGSRLDDPATPAGVAREAAAAAGALLRRVHAVELTGYGRLDTTGRGTYPSLRAWLLHHTPTPGGARRWAGLLDETRQALTAHADTIGDGGPPRLLHGDWAARHVITDRAQVTGLVDLASVRGGDPLTDLAAWSLQEPADLAAAHLDGYFPTPPGPATRTALTVYRLRIAASLLLWHLRRGDLSAVQLRARQLDADLADLTHGTPRVLPRIHPSTTVR